MVATAKKTAAALTRTSEKRGRGAPYLKTLRHPEARKRVCTSKPETEARVSTKKMSALFANHPNTHDLCREWSLPPDCPIEDISQLSTRLMQCTPDERGRRIYILYCQQEQLPIPCTWAGNFSRDALLKMQTWLNDNFTAKGRPTAAYKRELLATNFEWNNAAAKMRPDYM